MTKQQKITLSASRDIPFNKLMLSQSNVRHVKAGVSIEELAEDTERRTLLSSITVRPVLDDSGAETGMYTIPAGGRRFRALELLVQQKRMNKTGLAVLRLRCRPQGLGRRVAPVLTIAIEAAKGAGSDKPKGDMTWPPSEPSRRPAASTSEKSSP